MEHASTKTLSRRQALRAVGVVGGAALLGRLPALASEDAIGSPGASSPFGPENASLGSVRQVNAGLLNVGYAEVGPARGRAVVLLYGWPYDVHSEIALDHLVAPDMRARLISNSGDVVTVQVTEGRLTDGADFLVYIGGRGAFAVLRRETWPGGRVLLTLAAWPRR